MNDSKDQKAAAEPPLDCRVGRCGECGKAQADGWALYCVECYDNTEIAKQLLNEAILAMTELHDSMEPDENQECSLIKPEAVRKFVDAHARLIYEHARMVHNEQIEGRD